ncbi:MAG: siphovirus ReqiPepy6 Gp37-like family protein [Paraclostridium sp.]
MDLKIFNRQLDLIEIIDNFSSFRYKQKYYNLGECELHIAFSYKTLEVLKIDNIIYLDNKNSFIIHTIQINRNNDGSETIQVLGKNLISLLDRRINYKQIIEKNVSANNVIIRLLNENVISPTDAKRKIDNIVIGSLATASNIDYQNTYGNVLEELYSISKTHNISFYIELDYINKKLKFNSFSGIDKSTSQSVLSPCIFSQEFENIEEQEYVNSIDNYKNITLVAGAGEGAKRKLLEVGSGIGLDRVEAFTDARDLSDMQNNEDGTEVAITLADYNKMLLQRGTEKLEEFKKVQSFDSKISLASNLKYKEDFYLGDIVTIYNKNWGLKIDTRITEVEEVWEASKITKVVFGNSLPTLIEKIKMR